MAQASEVSRQQIHARIQSRHSVVQATLIRLLGDVDLAADAMQDAVVRALESWPAQGIPTNIVAWLVTAGMNSFRDRYRKDLRGRQLVAGEAELDANKDQIGASVDDDVLALIFMCCHPSIAVENQLALTLKLVMGFSQKEVASALLIQEKTLEQRLTRSKRKIKIAGIDFALPGTAQLEDRLQAVRQVLYLIFNEGYFGSSGQLLDEMLCRNAISLCRSLVRNYPQPENLGLLALMLFLDARMPARLDARGRLVTLDKQDRSLWRQSLIKEADVLLQKALRHKQAGRFQIQAAIAGLHSLSKSSAATDWTQIVGLYRLLLEKQPDPVVSLNYAVALLFAGQQALGGQVLHTLESALSQYSPYWAARARLAELQNNQQDRIEALQLASRLSGSDEEQRHYSVQLQALGEPLKNLEAIH